MFLLEGPHVKPSASQAYGKGLKTPEEILRSHFWRWLTASNPDGFCGKTSRASLVPLGEEISTASSLLWGNSGMGSHGQCLTLNTLEFRSDAVGSSLSHILERGNLPPRFYLSPKACAGILRRAQKRGKSLPPALQKALEETANKMTYSEEADEDETD